MTEGTKTKQNKNCFVPLFMKSGTGQTNNKQTKQTKKRKIKYGNKYNEDAASI